MSWQFFLLLPLYQPLNLLHYAMVLCSELPSIAPPKQLCADETSKARKVHRIETTEKGSDLGGWTGTLAPRETRLKGAQIVYQIINWRLHDTNSVVARRGRPNYEERALILYFAPGKTHFTSGTGRRTATTKTTLRPTTHGCGPRSRLFGVYAPFTSADDVSCGGWKWFSSWWCGRLFCFNAYEIYSTKIVVLEHAIIFVRIIYAWASTQWRL